jgi:nuclease-like protein
MANLENIRTIKLRYAGKCAACGAALPAGIAARWDRTARTATCVICAPTDGSAVVSAPDSVPRSGPSRQASGPPVPTSVAGRSADAEFYRRQAKRDARLEAKWGRFAGVAKFLSDDPQTTKAWAVGADGERRLARQMERQLGDQAVFLHDRKHGRANIDHVVVASSGIWVIDAKSYDGRIEYRNVAGWFRPADNRIYVAGRDQTKKAAQLGWQVDAVRKALAGLEAPIHPVLCFVNNNWGRTQKHFSHEGVLVLWGAKLCELIAQPGDLGPDEVEAVARRLSERLKPAS